MEPHRQKTILVVDDDADEARLIRDIFVSAGFHVATAHDGAVALQKARQLKPDLITMDLMMPKMSGLDVIQRLQADPQTRTIPVLVLSCIAQPGMFVGTPIESSPIVRIVPKPFEMNELLDAVRGCFKPGPDGGVRSKSVLLVDDDEEAVAMLSSFLEVKGYAVHTAFRASEALKIAQQVRPGLILLDLVLPDSDGFKVAEVLKAHPETANIPIILMTAAKLAQLTDPRKPAASYKDALLREIQRELQRVERSAVTSRKRRILLADDEVDLLRSLRDFLMDKGFDVVTAGDGAEALAALRSEPVDLAVLDVNMPKMDGHAVCAAIKADPLYRDLPVIMISVLEDRANRSRGLSAGADEYFGKPVAHEELLSSIEQWTDHMRPARAEPLTPFPGVAATETEMLARLAAEKPFSALFIDLTGFRAYNECYGFENGDRVIRRLAMILRESVAANREDFVGHYGGDDFVVLTGPESAPGVCRAVIAAFDAVRGSFYAPADRAKGYLLHDDPDGKTRAVPLASVSIGLAHVLAPRESSLGTIHSAGLKLRQAAKQENRSAYRAIV